MDQIDRYSNCTCLVGGRITTPLLAECYAASSPLQWISSANGKCNVLVKDSGHHSTWDPAQSYSWNSPGSALCECVTYAGCITLSVVCQRWVCPCPLAYRSTNVSDEQTACVNELRRESAYPCSAGAAHPSHQQVQLALQLPSTSLISWWKLWSLNFATHDL